MKVTKPIKSKVKHVFDELEKKVVENYELLSFPLIHRFTEGLYVRQMEVPSGCVITSKIHKEQHQFFVLKGKIIIWDEEGNEQFIQAPYIGITQANTRRVGYVVEDVIWATAHPNPENQTLEELESNIFGVDENELLNDNMLDKIKLAQNKVKEISNTIDNVKQNRLCHQQ